MCLSESAVGADRAYPEGISPIHLRTDHVYSGAEAIHAGTSAAQSVVPSSPPEEAKGETHGWLQDCHYLLPAEASVTEMSHVDWRSSPCTKVRSFGWQKGSYLTALLLTEPTDHT